MSNNVLLLILLGLFAYLFFYKPNSTESFTQTQLAKGTEGWFRLTAMMIADRISNGKWNTTSIPVKDQVQVLIDQATKSYRIKLGNINKNKDVASAIYGLKDVKTRIVNILKSNNIPVNETAVLFPGENGNGTIIDFNF